MALEFLPAFRALALLLGMYTDIMAVNFSVGGSLKAIGQVVAVLGDMAMSVVVMFVVSLSSWFTVYSCYRQFCKEDTYRYYYCSTAGIRLKL